MKTVIVSAFLLLSFAPVYSKTPVDPTPGATNSAEAAEAAGLMLRLDEINTMDKSNLTKSEKRVLRIEVKATKKRMNDLNGGVYLSAGALIIIILLLIILL
ncbi:MAG TPA: hypothetical protein VK508_14475 [Cyclobacteriaceae bacterium]|nr:hypothetical protein [Cyclobacteriaceae bacterium]